MIILVIIVVLLLAILILKNKSEHFNTIVNKYSPSNDMIVFNINYYYMVTPQNKPIWIRDKFLDEISDLYKENLNNQLNILFEPSKIYFAINNNTFKEMNTTNYHSNVTNLFKTSNNQDEYLKSLIGDLSNFNGTMNVYLFPYIGSPHNFRNINSNIIIGLFKKDKNGFVQTDINQLLKQAMASNFNIKLNNKKKLSSDDIITCVTNAKKIKAHHKDPIPSDLKLKMEEYEYNNKLIDRYQLIVDDLYYKLPDIKLNY